MHILFIDENREFDQHSKGIIDECFVKDNNIAINIINVNATEFFHCNPLQVAQRADCKAFLASDTVKKYLKYKWYHHFDDQHQLLKMNISIWVCQ